MNSFWSAQALTRSAGTCDQETRSKDLRRHVTGVTRIIDRGSVTDGGNPRDHLMVGNNTLFSNSNRNANR